MSSSIHILQTHNYTHIQLYTFSCSLTYLHIDNYTFNNMMNIDNYSYNIYIYIYIFTSKSHSHTTPSSERR